MSENIKDRISLSVIFPIYRVDNFLGEAILSLINQSFKDFEIIFVVDHGAEKDFQLFISNNEYINQLHYKCIFLTLKGLSYALNRGIEESRGLFIARMDSDDISHSSRFKKQINHMLANEKIGVLGCRVEIINEVGHTLSNANIKFYKSNKKILSVLRYRNPMCHPALMFRRDALLDIGGYMFGGYAEDYELLLRLARRGKYDFENLDERLFYYRKHHNQSTNISNAYRAFSDVSGFLFSEFIRTRDFHYLFGILVLWPPLRVARNFLLNMQYRDNSLR